MHTKTPFKKIPSWLRKSLSRFILAKAILFAAGLSLVDIYHWESWVLKVDGILSFFFLSRVVGRLLRGMIDTQDTKQRLALALHESYLTFILILQTVMGYIVRRCRILCRTMRRSVQCLTASFVDLTRFCSNGNITLLTEENNALLELTAKQHAPMPSMMDRDTQEHRERERLTSYLHKSD